MCEQTSPRPLLWYWLEIFKQLYKSGPYPPLILCTCGFIDWEFSPLRWKVVRDYYKKTKFIFVHHDGFHLTMVCGGYIITRWCHSLAIPYSKGEFNLGPYTIYKQNHFYFVAAKQVCMKSFDVCFVGRLFLLLYDPGLDCYFLFSQASEERV